MHQINKSNKQLQIPPTPPQTGKSPEVAAAAEAAKKKAEEEEQEKQVRELLAQLPSKSVEEVH